MVLVIVPLGARTPRFSRDKVSSGYITMQASGGHLSGSLEKA